SGTVMVRPLGRRRDAARTGRRSTMRSTIRPAVRPRSFAADVRSEHDVEQTARASPRPSGSDGEHDARGGSAMADLWIEESMLIDGKLQPAASGKTFENVNPATEEVVGVAADGG